MSPRGDHQRIDSRTTLLAGLGAGLAEVAWVALYGDATGMSGAEVARQVTASVVPAAANLAPAPLIGVAIHMALSVALGFAFARTIWRIVARRLGDAALLPAAIATLASIWAVNFFVVLPALNPEFVTLMPYGATLASKLLFGLGMVWVMRCAPARRMAAAGTHVSKPSLSTP